MAPGDFCDAFLEALREPAWCDPKVFFDLLLRSAVWRRPGVALQALDQCLCEIGSFAPITFCSLPRISSRVQGGANDRTVFRLRQVNGGARRQISRPSSDLVWVYLARI